MIQHLKHEIRRAVEDLKLNRIAIAFSGGVDSTLLAKVCSDSGIDVTLLTVAFSSDRDIQKSAEASRQINLRHIYEVIPIRDLEYGLKVVLKTIDFGRLARLENATCFYYVFGLASANGMNQTISANGLDELFCGYNIYKAFCGDEMKVRELMGTLVDTAKKDKEETGKVARLLDHKYLCPFLSDGFIKFAVNIPSNQKIIGPEDDLRKHILRKAALEMGIPRNIALRPKKAFQYSSGIHKVIGNLASIRGYNTKQAKKKGFKGKIHAYINSLLAEN